MPDTPSPDTKSIHTPVKGAFYTCGCYIGSDKPTPVWLIPPKCLTHNTPISYYVQPKSHP